VQGLNVRVNLLARVQSPDDAVGGSVRSDVVRYSNIRARIANESNPTVLSMQGFEGKDLHRIILYGDHYPAIEREDIVQVVSGRWAGARFKTVEVRYSSVLTGKVRAHTQLVAERLRYAPEPGRSFVYTPAKKLLGQGSLDLREAGGDIRVALVMSNTTADTDEDQALMSGFAVLDECDGANYARKALVNQAVNEDDPNNRAEFVADDIVWTALGAGTRQNVGMIVYKHVGADGVNIPILYIGTGGFPFNGNGSDITVDWNAEGIAQIT